MHKSLQKWPFCDYFHEKQSKCIYPNLSVVEMVFNALGLLKIKHTYYRGIMIKFLLKKKMTYLPQNKNSSGPYKSMKYTVVRDNLTVLLHVFEQRCSLSQISNISFL